MAKDKMAIEQKKCLTPEFRVSFPDVFTPKAFQGGEPKYSLTMLFDSKTDLKDLKRAHDNAALDFFGPKEKWPKNMRSPFRDGNEKTNLKGYEGTITVKASSKDAPGIVDQKRQEIISPEDFYAGCYARATIIAFAYDMAGNKGVSFALQNIQKLKEGEKFSGRKNAADEFTDVEYDNDQGF